MFSVSRGVFVTGLFPIIAMGEVLTSNYCTTAPIFTSHTHNDWSSWIDEHTQVWVSTAIENSCAFVLALTSSAGWEMIPL